MHIENTLIYYYETFMGSSRGSNASAPIIVSGSEDQILFDAGTGVGRRTREILVLMQKDGLDLARTTKICLTHSHPDHCRGVSFYRQIIATAGGKDNIPVYVHPIGVEFLKDPKLEQRKSEEELGPDRKAITKIPDSLVEIAFSFLCGRKRRYDNVHPLKDEQILELGGGHRVKVVYTPGHSRDHIAYLVDDHILISGDLISFKENDGMLGGLASLNNGLSDYGLEVQTLGKLGDYEITNLITSHYGLYSGKEKIREFFLQAKQQVEKMLENLEVALKEQQKPFRIKELVPRVIPFENYLSGPATRQSTVYCLLKHLVRQGKVKRELGPKGVTWSWAA
ncbi:MAG: hypothetical protein RBG13Loki_0987 [Promethearchaeota archaeon CR_4]|nr:MAG: hypothetical protein RBG13Loki_0987 [Candidatus Lokiarchaeota archaeon CR_4]